MDNTTKKSGKTIPCPNPECKQKVWQKFTFVGGTGDGEIKCSSCGKRLKVVISQKTIITLTILGIVLIIAILNEAVIAEKLNCSVFKTWEDAQQHYQLKLDHDRDGSACDALKK